ncbi:unnamed protein product, partial [Prorocentrum cordatum]
LAVFCGLATVAKGELLDLFGNLGARAVIVTEQHADRLHPAVDAQHRQRVLEIHVVVARPDPAHLVLALAVELDFEASRGLHHEIWTLNVGAPPLQDAHGLGGCLRMGPLLDCRHQLGTIVGGGLGE